MRRHRGWALATAAPLLLAVAGCRHHAQVAYAPPPPPTTQYGYPQAGEAAAAPRPVERSPDEALPGRPIFSQVGLASWYGPPYNNHRGANGKIYDENAITAAHRTLPMGSLIRVTDLATGRSAMMHITDRGPFVPGRILDLSVGAAKALGMYRAGVAKVRVDVYGTPKPIDMGGRWCVQIGAFRHSGAAKSLERHLSREYEAASVIEFTGPTGYWVRIRPENGNHRRAVEIANSLHPKEGEAYLVRLD